MTSATPMIFTPIFNDDVTTPRFYAPQPASGHCLIYVRNMDGSTVETGTVIKGTLLYKP